MIDLGPGIEFIEGFMLDICTVERDDNSNLDSVLDPATGALVAPSPTIMYNGKCHIRPTSRSERLNEDLGEAALSIRTYRVLLPLTLPNGSPVVGIKVGDVLRITQTDHEQDILGNPLHVVDVGHRTLPTYRRLIVQARRDVGRYV